MGASIGTGLAMVGSRGISAGADVSAPSSARLSLGREVSCLDIDRVCIVITGSGSSIRGKLRSSSSGVAILNRADGLRL